MAPLPVIDNVSRVTFNWGPTPKCANVMHFHQDVINENGLFTSINAHVTSDMWKLLPSFQVCSSLTITPLDGTSATSIFPTDGTAKWKGSATGDCIPASAYCVSLKTIERGRSARGRVFVGPLAETMNFNGMLSASDQATSATAWNAFAAAMITASSPWVVASYKNRTALTVINCSIRNAAATQRRRQSRLA